MNKRSPDETVVVIKRTADDDEGDPSEDKTGRKWQEADAKGGTR